VAAAPVEIEISADGKRVEVRPISEEYLKLARHPAYKDSALVQNAAAASRLIVTGTSYLSNMLASGAESFTQKTKPVAKPLTFKPATHDRVRKINSFTHSAASLSAKTVGQATKVAQNLGASLAGKGKKPQRGYDQDGNPVEEYRPGFLNKSMIAFSTIADGIAYSGKNLLQSSGAAATVMVGHKYGDDARQIAADLAGGVKNVGLVYIDVTGVSRRAVIKSVAKGMVVGKVKGGGEIIVGGGDGAEIPPQDIVHEAQRQHVSPPGSTTGPLGPGAPGFGDNHYGKTFGDDKR
jgi:spartin